ncbi:hypothetical protein BJX96DRAFT_171445 [Aspergillus floccosus]
MEADDIHPKNQLIDTAIDGSWDNTLDGKHLRSVTVDGLASTGMRDGILLLSWLVVLLRTREESQISFEWARVDRTQTPDGSREAKYLRMGELMPAGLKSSVRQVAAAISQQAANSSPSDPVTLVFSTSSMSQSSNLHKDGGTLHIEMHCVDNTLEIRPIWFTQNMHQFTITRYIEALSHTVQQCSTNLEVAVEELMGPIVDDLDQIWSWNQNLPPTCHFCMHDMVSERAQKCPDKVAISSWDGDLTYSQVDQYSTMVAGTLQQQLKVQARDIVPICFEKSKWTVVAVLAVMKSGATFVMMDPALPLARLQNMAQQVAATAMISSRLQYDLSMEILASGSHLIVDADRFASIPSSRPELPTVSPSTLMYVIFTSGSTGTPKGVTVSHKSYTSSAIARGQAVGYGETSRVLDFASYAFDVSIDSMLLTLGYGGCLCIPSDEDRLNDINGVFRKMKINYAGLTPSVARILEPDVIASLSMGLGLGGEAVSARDVALWGQDTRIIIGYGPCECTIGCTVNSSAATGRECISIGPGNGAAIWIVDPNDHNALVPVGAVGELLVEGPIVGQGYLNDPDKSAAAFINDPPWLVAGHKSHAGRRSRLYKTGDLGRYDPDGSGGIVFVGRKDTQVKLRGQRVELGEIESQIKARLPSDKTVIVEVIKPLESAGQPTLVAFITTQSSETPGQDHKIQLGDFGTELRTMLSTIDMDITKVLPRYMVPTAYIPVSHIPILISGKTDRKGLREFGATVDLRGLDLNANRTPIRDLTDVEERLRDAWGETLKLDSAIIRAEDNFFALGGDSLSAMRLVAICRTHGFEVTVASTFAHPKLSDMANVVKACKVEQRTETLPFSLIATPVDVAVREAAIACGVDQTAVKDIYPCTPTQESLFTFSLKSTTPYVAQRVACIPSHIELDAWKRAWEKVVAASPILRTRLAQLQDPGLQQVVLGTGICWKHSTSLADYLESDRKERMDLGQSLARYAIIEPCDDNKRYMVWTVHHVLYDGWSEPLILKQVSDTLKGSHADIQSGALINNFVKYVRETDEQAMRDYWRQELKGAIGPQFPSLPSRDYLPNPDGFLEREIHVHTSSGGTFTLATLIRASWALLASRYTGSDDVVFGETLTGRDIPLSGVESIVGPLIATVPVRIQVPRTSSVESYLQAVQQDLLARTPYQHMGMQNIRKVSEDAQHACEAPTGLVIQPDPEYIGDELGFEHGDVVREALHFNPYPLMLACGIRRGGFRICASFDTELIKTAQMEHVLAQLETTCVQLVNGLSQRVDEISCLPAEELDQIWQWNQIPPLASNGSPRDSRSTVCTNQGSVYPQDMISWVSNPRNPNLLSPIGCVGELWLEGDFTSDVLGEAPAWLKAGNSTHSGREGRIQPTGDMVRLQEDGSIFFVGRKESVLPVQGHAVDIAELDKHIKQYLSPKTRAAAVVTPGSPDKQQETSSNLLVLIEQQPSSEEQFQLLRRKHVITFDQADLKSFETAVCPGVSVSLATSLKRLDKFVRDSLPAYMAPSAYVVVEKLPTGMQQSDRVVFTHLASKIPQTVLVELNAGLKEAWGIISADSKLTSPERVLRSAWADILRLSPDELDVDDNFFRRGGDSVSAMKLVSNLRAQGYTLTVADIFRHMRLGDAAKRLKTVRKSVDSVQKHKQFSLLGNLDIEQFCAEIVKPQLAEPAHSIQDIYPVTDSQMLDIRGTIHAPCTSVQYTILYFDQAINRDRLIGACNTLVKTHDVLRTVFIEHEANFLQVVMSGLDAPVVTLQAAGNLNEYVSNLCAKDIDSSFALGSPFFKTFHVQSDDGRDCLVLRLSHAQYDGMSLPRLLHDLETLYRGNEVADILPFSSYVVRSRDAQLQAEAIKYWRNALNGSSLSILAGPAVNPTDRAIFRTKPVGVSISLGEITTATLLTGAWALVLARRLQTSDVLFGGVTSGRHIDLANVHNVMGPCYQLTPIRVSFKPDWTARDLLQSVQQSIAGSAAYDFLGLEAIRKQCTDWSAGAQFFDSIVHHQDWEDFDTMDFAGGKCRVDIQNPHGDAAYPWKAVSFVRGGQLHVGVVGSEEQAMFVDGVLSDLVVAVEDLGLWLDEVLKV